MTVISMKDHDTNTRADLRIWNCDSCSCVHLRAANVLLTFMREEYAVAPDEFTRLPSITEMVN